MSAYATTDDISTHQKPITLPIWVVRCLPHTRIAKCIQRHPQTVWRWLHGINYPNGASIARMRDAGLWYGMRAIIRDPNQAY